MRALAAVLLASLAFPALPDDYLIIVPARKVVSVSSVRAACSDARSEACLRAKESLAQRAAEDLVALGQTRDRTQKPLILAFAGLPYASVRAATASALGAMAPEAADTPALSRLLDDPVPVVRQAAQRALASSEDHAARLLAERALKAGPELQPDSVPDPKSLGGSVYPGARYLFFASHRAEGVAAYASADPLEAVRKFYAAKALSPPMTPADLEKAYRKQQPASSTFDPKDAMEMARRYREAMAAGKSPQEAAAAMAGAATEVFGLDIGKVASAYERREVFGDPLIYVLEKASGLDRPRRLAVVLRDLATNGVEIVLHAAPDRR